MMKNFIPCLLIAILSGSALSLFAEDDGSDKAPSGEVEEHKHFGERLAETLNEKGVPEEAVVVLVSTLPIVELRGAIPIGNNLFKMKDRWWMVYMLAVAGNMIPIPFILLALGPISRQLMKFKMGERFFDWLFARTRRKSASIEKYETLGLAIFVAIPLPVTGGWTGAMAAFLMGIKFKHAMWSIFLGVLIAGVIVTTLSLLGWIGAIIAAVVLIALAVNAILRMFRREGVEG